VLKETASEYVTADLFQPGVDVVLDLQTLDLPSESVDVFVCSHLLEHVPDDRKALTELRRCLALGGRALIMVPVIEGWKQTYENASVESEQDRALHFGQFDHVRFYGADVRKRIIGADFDLTEFVASPGECIRFGLLRGETVFVASPRKNVD
jgi:SAM-dependent methyltransferase